MDRLDRDRLTSGYGLIEGPVWDPRRGLLFKLRSPVPGLPVAAARFRIAR